MPDQVYYRTLSKSRFTKNEKSLRKGKDAWNLGNQYDCKKTRCPLIVVPLQIQPLKLDGQRVKHEKCPSGPMSIRIRFEVLSHWFYGWNMVKYPSNWWFQPLWKIWKSVGMIIPIYGCVWSLSLWKMAIINGIYPISRQYVILFVE
jgi:hypothetical protein